MAKQLCIHCYVSGKVQGVWFRASAKEEAEKLGLTGWAKNLNDGRVEVIACGEEEQLETFYSWLQDGPQLAHVDKVEREEKSWENHTAFQIL
ncbi:acylphosphatase [Legionella israelensis]|uniref:Acylphosphatase n=1 Tax=Legionella israelensis TaxID=454 RepID=A0A0W0V2S5_9GAMM|nr:acylphosphatase [Legionella israelensis]KTD14403.1 acylphosphatase [Legionella israelensis]QBR84936.1 acylphosphatase [Legionella israelensis]QBS10175.1 acylphosphatase [Legionella israelensis]QDP73417.1 acylphosphatase [Legionella israelensis]SCY35166.1 acylphosphatase [Legionella israelensis DSM 19235]